MDGVGQGLSEEQVLAALERDDAFQVVRVLADKGAASTELVRLPGSELRVRKRIPIEVANERAWVALIDIRDPLLPRVREVYRLPDQLVVVCDYLEGLSLGELVSAVGRLDAHETVRRTRELCHAAGVLHAHGIVHRDISPGNVIVSATGTHLIDLGNARTPQAGARRDTTLLGTYGFASPEQYGFAQTDARSDIYSLGRLCAYMLTGVLPSDTDFDAAYLDAQVVTPQLRAVIDRACAFEPSARYQRAEDLSYALLEAVRDSAPASSGAPGQAQGARQVQEGRQVPAAQPAPGERPAAPVYPIDLGAASGASPSSQVSPGAAPRAAAPSANGAAYAPSSSAAGYRAAGGGVDGSRANVAAVGQGSFPSARGARPAAQPAGPSAQATGPAAQPAGPRTQSAGPRAQATGPFAQAASPAPQAADPTTQANASFARYRGRQKFHQISELMGLPRSLCELPFVLTAHWPSAQAKSKIAVILYGLSVPFWIMVLVAGGFDPTRYREPNHALLYPWYSIFGIIVTLAIVGDLMRHSLRAGVYQGNEDRSLVWRRVGGWLAIFFELAVLVGVIVSVATKPGS